MKASPLYLNLFHPFNLFLLLSLIMNHLCHIHETKETLVSASENTEGDIEIIIHDDSAVDHKEEKEHHSNYSFTRIQYMFSHFIAFVA